MAFDGSGNWIPDLPETPPIGDFTPGGGGGGGGGGGSEGEMLSGTGSPVGNQTPGFIGQLYHDEDADAYWRSTGTASSDWTIIREEGLLVGPLTTTVDFITWDGNLDISAVLDPTQDYTAISFNGVVEVTGIGNVDIQDSDLISAKFPDLTTIGGDLIVSGCDLLTTLLLPALETVGNEIGIDASQNLTSLAFPRLASVVGNITVALDGCTAIDFSTLETAGNEIDLDCPVLTSVNFDSFVTGSNISLDGCPLLESLNLPVCTTLNGNLTITDNNVITSISAPLLETCSTISIGSNPSLTSINFPLLEDMSGGLFEAPNTGLTSLSLPSLVSVTAVFCSSNAALTSVSLPSWVPLDGQACDFQNCALDASSVNHILAIFVAAGVTGCTISLQDGTNAAPTGQGIIDAAALVTAGNTVTTN